MTFKDIVRNKLARLATGKPLRVLDLFSGCGGISLGFHRAGCEIIGNVEIDERASETHAFNFHGHLAQTDPELYEVHKTPKDIEVLEPADLMTLLGFGDDYENCVDIIVGGPPCQAFTRVGRAKLREIKEHPTAYLQDSRGGLYKRYLHYVEQLKPLAILMENVPEVISYGKQNIPELVCHDLARDGRYNCAYTVLNAVHYGVPQMRQRMFLMAYAGDFGMEVHFPKETHTYELPRGYLSSKRVALKGLFGYSSYYRETSAEKEQGFQPAVTTEQAISDLPHITDHLTGNLKKGAQFFDKYTPYPHSENLHPYAIAMRNWPGFKNLGGIWDHVIRKLPRDYPIFARMKQGDQYPEAINIANAILQEKLKEKNLAHYYPDTPEYQAIWKETVPPYDPKKFPNKWRKLEQDEPSRTLMAHLGKDSYSHIHYSDKQARTISVREAARLQSFPDGFKFKGAMNAAFRQIGNAVPPLLSFHFAREMTQTLKSVSAQEEALATIS